MKEILDWNSYIDCSRRAVAEGMVLLENHNNVLPFTKGMNISVFGRIQTHYYKSGTGSGGMVNVSHVTGIPEGLRESGVVTLNEDLEKIYTEWEKENPFDTGLGWGMEPWSQKEMELSEDIVKQSSAKSDAALFIIGRTAGEDKDAGETEGSYCLSKIEKNNLELVRKHFKKLVVLLNVGGLIELDFIENCKPDSVIIGWQGGMVGGLGTADVLTGKVSPSGHLTDTVAYKIKDYLSDQNFGDAVRNYYKDDIYVGYRYFETFAKDKVRYPFGYGLSYTSFAFEAGKPEYLETEKKITVPVTVKNTGNVPGKAVVQLYVSAPEGKLEKPAKVLAGFEKTEEIPAGSSVQLNTEIFLKDFASFDEKGVTGHKSCSVLEAGTYTIFAGENIRDAEAAGSVEIGETVIRQYNTAFDENLEERISKFMPEEIPYTGNKGIMLKDVYEGKSSLKDFVAQLSDEELMCIVRGEGMGSSLVTAGTASAFGGVSKKLRGYGIAPVCCDDGPSGMRLDCGTKAFSLPNGTMLACTFNTKLNRELFEYLGLEMCSNKVDCLLGPGVNIHRHPLNGRNFEYFSEDPLLTGRIATAQLEGLKSRGVSGTLKHFAGNNQEFSRRESDSVISERALREIYLRAFEIAVESGKCDSIMTTYGMLNGEYTAGNYDLCNTILHKDWNFKGVVMSDWWASISRDQNGKAHNRNFAKMIRAGNDLYMVCPDGERNAIGENMEESLKEGKLNRSELQQIAMNVCTFELENQAFLRTIGKGLEVEIINRPKDEDDVSMDDVEYKVLGDEMTVDLGDAISEVGSTFVFAFDVTNPGLYSCILRASSELGEVAQLPCTYFYNGFPISTVTFHGTNGQLTEVVRGGLFHSRFVILRLVVGARGLKLKDITFKKVDSVPESEKFSIFGS